MDLDLNFNMGIECVFTAEVFNNEGVVETIGPFTNTVLDVGLIKLNNYSIFSMTTFINVGTATTPADPSQTGLLARLYSTSNIFNAQQFQGYNPWPVRRTYTKVLQFNVGTCTGEFNEVGLSRVSNGEYFNRQRFKNSAGYLVTVRVKANEGLRVTCELRLIPDPATRVYSQVYELNLQGNTAGTITFSNGASTREFSYAELTTSGSAKLAFEKFLGVGSVVNYVLVDGKYYILFHPLNNSAYTLSIQSHTLTGGGGAPGLLTAQAFTDPKVPTTFPFDDVPNGGVASKDLLLFWVLQMSGMNFLTMKVAAASATLYSGWGNVPNGTSADLIKVVFGSFSVRAITQTPALPVATFIQSISTPTPSDIAWVKRVYYAPAALGAGTRVVTGFTLYNTTGDNLPVLCLVKLVNPITVPAGEEFEFNFKLSWGRTS